MGNNMHPNQSGLQQNQRKKKPKRKRPTLTKAEKEEKAHQALLKQLKAMQLSPDDFVDAYTLKIAENKPNDVKVFKELLKWKELKDKRQSTEDEDDDLDMEMFKTSATQSVESNPPEKKEAVH